MQTKNKPNSKTHVFLIPIGVFLCQERKEKENLIEQVAENISKKHNDSRNRTICGRTGRRHNIYAAFTNLWQKILSSFIVICFCLIIAIKHYVMKSTFAKRVWTLRSLKSGVNLFIGQKRNSVEESLLQ